MSEGFDYISTGKCKEEGEKAKKIYDGGMEAIKDIYAGLIKAGADVQDARGILPTNISTNIMVKLNLRALSGLMNERLCYKAQGEFQSVAREMRRLVLLVHPWAAPVLQVNCVQYGVCKFKNFKECPLKMMGLVKDFDPAPILEAWEHIQLEVQPKGVTSK